MEHFWENSWDNLHLNPSSKGDTIENTCRLLVYAEHCVYIYFKLFQQASAFTQMEAFT